MFREIFANSKVRVTTSIWSDRGVRINKYISETGFCSRREADMYVQTRKVTINGVVAGLGSTVQPGDDVRVNGRPVGQKKAPVYIALYKPVGITSTTDRRDPTNIVDYVGHPERIFPIGRLDKDSEGLILLTNDGDIVNKILRAEGQHDKEYIVTVNKPITSAFIRGMANGVRILGTVTRKCEVNRVADRVFRIILTEGKNRQIRRMCEVFGYEVQKLLRTRIMNITVDGLKPGQYRDLTPEELQGLFKMLDYQPDLTPVEKAPKQQTTRESTPPKRNQTRKPPVGGKKKVASHRRSGR